MIPTIRGVHVPLEVVREVLKLGSDGVAVVVLQDLLKAHGVKATGPSDGDFGPATEAAVLTFQQQHGLEVDGRVGPATWSALTSHVPDVVGTVIPPSGDARAQELLGVALSEIGAREIPDGSNGGGRVDAYTGRWRVPWCALFLSWCLRQCSWNPWPKPIAAVVKVKAWALERKLYEVANGSYVPEPGDLFVMLRAGQAGVDPQHGHVGIVLAYDARSKMIRTVEGNASNAVRTLARPVSEMDGYVRITAV